MVPLDKPEEALAMFSAFASHRALAVLDRRGGRGGGIPATVLQSAPEKREKRQSFIRSRASNAKKLLGTGGRGLQQDAVRR